LPPMAGWSGLRLPLGSNMEVTIVKVRCDISAGTRGADLGPDAIEIAAINRGSHLFDEHDFVDIETENRAIYDPVEEPFAKRVDALRRIFLRLSNCVGSLVLSPGSFPLVLAGGHGTAGGTIAGIKLAYPDKRLGVVWIDAHADVHSPWTTPSGNLHGMPVAMGLGEDHLALAKNSVSKETATKWKQLQQVGGIQPKFEARDLVYIGVRDTEEEERQFMAEKQIRNITVEELRRSGPEGAGKTALEYLKGCDVIYVSFDVDSLDISISNGTGTPVANGFFVQEVKVLIQTLLDSGKVCCFEVAEVNPTLDKQGNVTAEIAFDVMEMVVGHMESEK
jgi:arginase